VHCLSTGSLFHSVRLSFQLSLRLSLQLLLLGRATLGERVDRFCEADHRQLNDVLAQINECWRFALAVQRAFRFAVAESELDLARAIAEATALGMQQTARGDLVAQSCDLRVAQRSRPVDCFEGRGGSAGESKDACFRKRSAQ